MILVDTSVLVDLFRGRDTDAVAQFVVWEREGADLRVPAICAQELLQGARDVAEWRLLDAYLSTQALVVAGRGWTDHRDAARLYFDCRRAGVTLRGTIDCMVAQLAIALDGVLLHDDVDYERIATVVPLRLWR